MKMKAAFCGYTLTLRNDLRTLSFPVDFYPKCIYTVRLSIHTTCIFMYSIILGDRALIISCLTCVNNSTD